METSEQPAQQQAASEASSSSSSARQRGVRSTTKAQRRPFKGEGVQQQPQQVSVAHRGFFHAFPDDFNMNDLS
eukprot:CAMPEP_0116830594 /NCGR_PEP_ID=MMETSP0418-20121206/4847_1 /TAXON_ID=1158023 /ORGANISM="Astrosyne radiata, Strain 13vi08-1A" /LENGTH=72 /DNA_ID=CAMNT_0004459709 /DNA_START=91 /DNA_END=309 /DNA_ORIENTATION=+